MTTATATISVLLVDDHRIVREGLRALLSAQTDMKVIGEAEDGYQALELAAELKPDVMVLDVLMPKMGGFEVLGSLLDWPEAPAVVMCSMHDQGLSAAMALGASGFVDKRAAARNLVETVRKVATNA